MKLLLWLKAQAYVVGAGLLIVLAFFARLQWVKSQRDKAIEARDREKARADQSEANMESDQEIDLEFSELKRESENDIENDEMPDNIRDRNNFS